jgi:serine phosphatase RsbU (regulator of sigma subunit)/pSer/pThr/pTyr-binding forkhead associated (FHA) protein
MASLHILKGANQGKLIALDKDKIVLGRNPDCDVVIPVTSVSREHAQILRNAGRFFILDLQSRNGTFVNNQQISGRTALQNNDRIRICDFVAAFQETSLPPLPPELAKGADEASDEQELEPEATYETTITGSTNLLLENQSAERLKLLLEISANLSKTLELDPLLPKIVDSLFQLFKQADRCFIILAEDGGSKMIPKVIKTRRPQDESNARFSRSIVKRCLESGNAYLSDDAQAGVPLSQSVVDFRIRSVMSTPLLGTEGRGFGVIQLDTQDRNKKFTEEDLKLLWCVTNQAAIAMENARLHEARLEQVRVKRDLELAHQVQLSFLPQKLPELSAYSFFAHYEPAQQVGGDYYDFVPLPEQRLAVTLGDVAGKGMPAAMLMAKLSSDARFALMSEKHAGAAINRLNHVLYQTTSQNDRFVTFAAALLDPQAHTVEVVNAGHMPPLLYRRTTGTLDDAVSKELSGMPLGILETQEYATGTTALQAGDCLLLFSDGVTDAVNLRNEPFGLEGIHAALAHGGPFTPRSLVERLVRAVRQHAAGRNQHDDISLVCFGRDA